jgi:hypothetical protein
VEFNFKNFRVDTKRVAVHFLKKEMKPHGYHKPESMRGYGSFSSRMQLPSIPESFPLEFIDISELRKSSRKGNGKCGMKKSWMAGIGIFMFVCVVFIVIIMTSGPVQGMEQRVPEVLPHKNLVPKQQTSFMTGSQFCFGNASDYRGNVRICSGISSEESEFVFNRTRDVVSPAIAKLVSGKNLKIKAPTRIPKIAIASGGGGYRGTISMMGFLSGLFEGGILDMSTYVSSSGGAAWFYLPFIMANESIEVFRNQFSAFIYSYHSLFPMKKDVYQKALYDLRAEKKLFGEVSVVDWLGKAFAYHLFGNYSSILFNTPFKKAINGNLNPILHPFPIFSASGSFDPQSRTESTFEVTSCEFGSFELKKWVDVDLIGSNFDQGSILQKRKEFDIVSFFSMIGITHEVSPVKVYRKYLLNQLENDDYIAELERLFDEQITSIAFPNYLQNFDGSDVNSTDDEYLFLRNSVSNLPMLSFLNSHRSVDCIIFFDPSSDLMSLCKVKSKADELKLSFPEFEFCADSKNSPPPTPFRIFKPKESHDGITVIYLSLTNQDLLNAKKTNLDAFKVIFTPEQVDQISALSKSIVNEHADEITDVILEYSLR